MNRKLQMMLVAGTIAAGVTVPALAAPDSAVIAVETSAQAEGQAASQGVGEAAERRDRKSVV